MTEMRMRVFLFFLNLPFMLHHVNIVSRAQDKKRILFPKLKNLLVNEKQLAR